VETRESLGQSPAVIIDGRDPANYVNTDQPGFWENLLEPGDAVKAGDPVGRLWFPEQPERGPRIFAAPLDGILTVVRAMTPTLAGDSVFVTGQPIEKAALL
jgi:predicted deacylase